MLNLIYLRTNQDVRCLQSDVFKLEDRAIGTILVRMFSNCRASEWEDEKISWEDEILKWIPTYCIFRIFHFSDLSSGQFSAQPIISLYEITLLPMAFEPKVINE